MPVGRRSAGATPLDRHEESSIPRGRCPSVNGPLARPARWGDNLPHDRAPVRPAAARRGVLWFYVRSSERPEAVLRSIPAVVAGVDPNQACTEELVRAGVPRREAARRARVRFGSIEGAKDDCRRARGLRLADEISAETGETRWLHSQRSATMLPVATGGGLVFGGDVNGRFRAFDQETGEVLWEINLGSAVTSFPISSFSSFRVLVGRSDPVDRCGLGSRQPGAVPRTRRRPTPASGPWSGRGAAVVVRRVLFWRERRRGRRRQGPIWAGVGGAGVKADTASMVP